MTPTTDDILALCALAQERGPWTVVADGGIRNTRGECPVCATVNVVLGTDYKLMAHSAFGALVPAYGYFDAVDDVVGAADYPTDHRRRDLMLALGMEATP